MDIVFHINNYYSETPKTDIVLKTVKGNTETLLFNTQKLDNMAKSLQDISDKADELQIALDAEQEQIKAALDDLKKLIADGGTEAQRQAVYDKISAIIVDTKSTIPDAPVPPTP